MRITAAVGVKDEVELVEPVLGHLRAIGVDRIIAFDMGSSDGTLEILETQRSQGDLELIRLRDEDGESERVRRIVEVVKDASADWVLFLDADEFPVPASGSLRDCAALNRADAVKIDRYNVPLLAGGPAMPRELGPGNYRDLLLIVDAIPSAEFWSSLDREPTMSWMRIAVAPRVMARPGRIEGLTLGTHDIVAADPGSLRRARAVDLLMAHVPFTTRERFLRKVENIRALRPLFDSTFGSGAAQHWRRWFELSDQGLLDEEFDRMVFGDEEIAELRDQRVIHSAAEVFARRAALNPEDRELEEANGKTATGTGHADGST